MRATDRPVTHGGGREIPKPPAYASTPSVRDEQPDQSRYQFTPSSRANPVKQYQFDPELKKSPAPSAPLGLDLGATLNGNISHSQAAYGQMQRESVAMGEEEQMQHLLALSRRVSYMCDVGLPNIGCEQARQSSWQIMDEQHNGF